MEPHASIAEWNGEQLTVYEATQSVMGVKALLSSMLGIPAEKVRVIARYIGGGFGSKGFTWANPFLAAMAAKQFNRPVKIALARQQVYLPPQADGHKLRKKLSLVLTTLANCWLLNTLQLPKLPLSMNLWKQQVYKRPCSTAVPM